MLPLWLGLVAVAQGAATGRLDQLHPDPGSFAKSWLKRTQEQTHAPGLVLVLVRGDTVVSSMAIGVANQETGQSLTPTTLFRIGSVTKSFTAAAVLGLEFSRIGDLDVVGHVGNLPGFTAYVRMIPSSKIGVIVLANANQAHLDEATDEALCYLLNKRPPCPTSDSTSDTTIDSGPPLQNFVGQYENTSRISIVLRNGQLFWLADPKDKYVSAAMRAGMPLRRMGNYRFARTYPGDVFFVLDSTGKPRYVLLHDVAYKKIG